MPTLRLATRGSALALAQTRWVAARLEAAHPGLQVTWEVFKTTGDATQAAGTPLAEVGAKGLFTKELEAALLDGRADLAVHSLKDLPTDLPPGLALLAVPEREDPRDAVLSSGIAFVELPRGAHIGTSSLRRMAQLCRLRPDLQFRSVRGNVDTRLRKLHEGQYAALIMAAAGLRRLGLQAHITEYLDPAVCLPAVGQGALGLEGRSGDAATAALCAALTHAETLCTTTAERAFLRTLTAAGLAPAAEDAAASAGGTCQVPIAAHCRLEAGRLVLHGLVAAVDGSEVFSSNSSGAPAQPEALGSGLAEALLQRGARRLLASVAGPP